MSGIRLSKRKIGGDGDVIMTNERKVLELE